MTANQTQSKSEIIYEFNYFPNRYLDQTWWKSLKYGRELALLGCVERTERRVAELILKFFKLTDCYHSEFDSSLEKLALLPKTEISLIANHLGLCFTCQNINRSILKSEKLEYKQQLGDEVYSFANTDAPKLRNTHNISEIFPVKKGFFLVQNHSIGLHVLGKAFANTERALKQRLILKLGKPNEKFIRETSDLIPLSTSQSNCISLIEAIAQHVGHDVGSKLQTDDSEE